MSVDASSGSKRTKTSEGPPLPINTPADKFKGDKVAPEISAFFQRQTPSVGPTSDVPAKQLDKEEILCLDEAEGKVYGADVDIIHMAGAPGPNYPINCQKLLEEGITTGMLEAKVPPEIQVKQLANAVATTGVDWNDQKANSCAWIIDSMNRGRTAAILAEPVGFGKV